MPGPISRPGRDESAINALAPAPTASTSTRPAGRKTPIAVVDAADDLRRGLSSGAYRAHTLDEAAMFGVARLLDAVVDPTRRGFPPGREIVGGALEIARHVGTRPAAELQSDA